METRDIVKKLVDSLIDSNGYAYTSGYLESKLVDVINRFVTDKTQLHMLHDELLNKASEREADACPINEMLIQ